MALPKQELTKIYGLLAEFPEDETKPEFMNNKFNELLVNDMYLDEEVARVERVAGTKVPTATYNVKMNELDQKNLSQDEDINKRVLQTTYDTKMTEIDNRNLQQDNSIANKVNNATFTAAKQDLEYAIMQKLSNEEYTEDKGLLDKKIEQLQTTDATLQTDINKRVLTETYATDKEALESSIAEKTTTTLNGEKTNVNFIENQVVQNGLVGNGLTTNLPTQTALFSNISLLNFPAGQASASILKVTDTTKGIASSGTSSDKVSIKYNGYTSFISLYTQQYYYIYSVFNIKTRMSKNIILDKNGNVVKLTNWTEYVDIETPTNQVIADTRFVSQSLTYNRELALAEIQHNLSVLNNTPSINHINDYAISTDTNHVQDRTGRVQEQINRVFYKQNCKEFTSSGEAIVVNNGMDGYVLSGFLQGNTIKNYSLSYNSIVNKTFSSTSTVTNSIGKAFNLANIELNKQYTIICKISRNTLPSGQGDVGGIRIVRGESFGMNNVKFVDGGVTGVVRHTFTTPSIAPSDFNSGNCNIFVYPNSSVTTQSWEVVVDWWCCVEGNGSNISDNGTITDGLNSTQAIISNNGVKYSFYLNNEDKLANRVIDLGGMEGARNVLEIKEDGSAVYTQNTKEGVLNGEGDYRLYAASQFDGSTLFTIEVGDVKQVQSNIGIYSNDLSYKTVAELTTGNQIGYTFSSYPKFYIRMKTTNSADLNEVKEKLKQNPVTVRYQLATPIVTTIPKELVPTILTQATNTFIFGDAVAPYSVTIKAPVTDGISKSYAQTLLNGYTQTVGTATPVVNLLNTGLVRLQMDLTAPSTGMNATLFTFPTELRPVTTQRIPVFVNGVCQLATIDKTTGNVNLASVPSAGSNVYIKSDYRRDI